MISKDFPQIRKNSSFSVANLSNVWCELSWSDAVCRRRLIGEILSSMRVRIHNVCVTWGPYNIYRRAAEGTEHERASHPSTFISSHTQSVILAVAAVVCVCVCVHA